ncbi:hypothetical protein ABN028_28795 [Actinopolymorpha sp. B17G11]|uniref:hypothetical protein n=1 Tax=Actinopolymorpha sp. B17G11 TaxID=3160861 RepID=UPI0032E3A454
MEDPDAARAEITANWQKFFNPQTTKKQKVHLLEDAELYVLFVHAFADDPDLGQATATVEKVTFTSATSADVTFTLSQQHKTILSGVGQSVRQDDTWKISVKTLCAVAETRNVARPAACEPAIW